MDDHRDIPELGDVLRDLSDSEVLRRARAHCFWRLAREFRAPLVAACDYLPDERVIEGFHYLGDDPRDDEARLARCAALDAASWQRLAIVRPTPLSRDYVEKNLFPRREFVEWYSTYDYREWMEVPFASAGCVVGKLSLMVNRRLTRAEQAALARSEAFQTFRALWLTAKGIARLRSALLDSERERISLAWNESVGRCLDDLLVEAERATETIAHLDPRSRARLERMRQLATRTLTQSRRIVSGLRAKRHPEPPRLVRRSSRTARVLLVDDHQLVLEGLAAVLGHEPEITVVGTASNGREALAQFASLRPDVVVLDIRLPDIDGVEVARRIIAQHPGARILMLSAYGQPELIAHSTEAGARGFLLKGAASAELTAAIRSLHRGATFFGAGVMETIGLHLRQPRLSPREREILPLVAQGLLNKQIAGRLGVTEETIKDRLRVLYRKLSVHGRVELLARAAQMGLLPGAGPSVRESPLPPNERAGRGRGDHDSLPGCAACAR